MGQYGAMIRRLTQALAWSLATGAATTLTWWGVHSVMAGTAYDLPRALPVAGVLSCSRRPPSGPRSRIPRHRGLGGHRGRVVLPVPRALVRERFPAALAVSLGIGIGARFTPFSWFERFVRFFRIVR